MKSEFEKKLINEFEQYENSLNGEKGSSLFHSRKAALAAFSEIGIPTIKHEEWKYTNVSFLKRKDFSINFKHYHSELQKEDIRAFLIGEVDAHIAVFVNGFFQQHLSDIVETEIEISTLGQKISEDIDHIDKYFGGGRNYSVNPFLALNDTIAQDGLYIDIPRGRNLEKPLHILFINDSSAGSLMSSARNIIRAGAGSSLKLIQSFVTIGENDGMFNNFSTMELDEDASVSMTTIQDDSPNSIIIDDLQVEQKKSSRFKSVSVNYDGSFVRNNVNVLLDGEGADTDINGFFLTDGKRLSDNHILVDHAVPNCTSNQFFKGIVDDSGNGVFNGKILVRQDAQKTNAYQTNKNIMLNNDAKINTKPQLEIYADDVKCSHGATSGYLDDDSMFYMRSRGIDPDMARSLLLKAFAAEVVEKVEFETLRNYINEKIAARLNG